MKKLSLLLILFLTIPLASCVSQQPKSEHSNKGFVEVGNLQIPRIYHTAVTLKNGKTLIIGGERGDAPHTIEQFDPKTQKFTLLNTRTLYPHEHPEAVLLSDDNVLISDANTKNLELLDTSTQTFKPIGKFSRLNYTGISLPNGDALFTCGTDEHNKNESSVQFYNSKKHLLETQGKLLESCYVHGSALLTNQKVLLSGYKNFQLYDIKSHKTQLIQPSPEMKKIGLIAADFAIYQTNSGQVFLVANDMFSKRNGSFYFSFDSKTLSFSPPFKLPLNAGKTSSFLLKFIPPENFIVFHRIRSKSLLDIEKEEVRIFRFTNKTLKEVSSRMNETKPPSGSLAVSTSEGILFTGGGEGVFLETPSKQAYLYHL